MRDVLIIVPTRFRPGNAQRLIDSVTATSVLQTDVALAIDEDDESYSGLKCTPNVSVDRGPRMSCIGWTNKIAAERGAGYRALASFGDDHEPQTAGWDAALLGAIADMGGTGIAYGDDTLQHATLPTAPVVSSDIVAALGWFMLPGLGHFFADNVWKDLGERAGCLRYVPQVVIRHYHYAFGTAPVDAVYIEAAPAWDADHAAYRDWCWGAGPADVEKVRALRS